jgi:hypothetical protein
MAGATYNLQLRENAAHLNVKADGATLGALDKFDQGLCNFSVTFPDGTGYQPKTVTLTW